MKNASYFIIYISIISRTYCVESYRNIIVTHTHTHNAYDARIGVNSEAPIR